MDYTNFISLPIQTILDKAMSNVALSREELITLLALDANSIETDVVRFVGRYIAKQRFGTRSMLICQTGVESFACAADCAFCNFRKSSYTAKAWRMDDARLAEINACITEFPGTYAHFLLFMHTFDFSYVLSTVEKTRAQLPKGSNVVINCGDFDAVQAAEIKSAGASGAYHVVRLGEGIDTKLRSEQRIKSIESLKKADLDWYTCCEPIGPEHSNEEIIDNILQSAHFECFQNAAMRRINFPGSALEARGQISLLRSAQIVAIIAIALRHNPKLACIAIHEPDLLGLSSGANCVYAEFGPNPRDLTTDTTLGRGHSVLHCQAILRDAGFTSMEQNKGCEDILL